MYNHVRSQDSDQHYQRLFGPRSETTGMRPFADPRKKRTIGGLRQHALLMVNLRKKLIKWRSWMDKMLILALYLGI